MANGDDTFLHLLRPHYADALRYCQALCRDRSQAADLFQQSVLRAMEKLDQLGEEARFKPWFFRIITTQFYGQARQPWWKIFVSMKEDEADHPAEWTDLFEDDGSAGHSRLGLLFTALDRLSPKERSAILLFEVGDFSIEDIRQIQQEASLSAVKSRLSRSREKLRQAILQLESTHNPALRQGDISHEAATLISRYR